jgi:hypothetical protein
VASVNAFDTDAFALTAFDFGNVEGGEDDAPGGNVPGRCSQPARRFLELDNEFIQIHSDEHLDSLLEAIERRDAAAEVDDIVSTAEPTEVAEIITAIRVSAPTVLPKRPPRKIRMTPEMQAMINKLKGRK